MRDEDIEARALALMSAPGYAKQASAAPRGEGPVQAEEGWLAQIQKGPTEEEEAQREAAAMQRLFDEEDK